MPLFQYEAVSERGKKIIATIDADHLQDAKLKLIRRQIAVLRIQPIKNQVLKSSNRMQSLTVLGWSNNTHSARIRQKLFITTRFFLICLLTSVR